MGSSSSRALSFDQISQACIGISLTRPKDGFCVNFMNSLSPNVYASTSFLIQQKVIINQPEYPAIFKNSLAANFEGFDFTATLQNINNLQFDAFSLAGHFKPHDNIDCNFQASFGKSPIYTLMTNYASNILNSNLSLITTNDLSQVAYKIASGFAINDIFHLGLGVSQNDLESPFKLSTSGFVNLGALQFSTAYEKLIRKGGDWNYTFGTNLLLDPYHIINFCFETNQEQSNGLAGYFFQVNDSSVNATISTDGQITSLFSRQINEQIHLDTGISFIFKTLTVSPSIDIQISS
ncbi:hypothetical protein M9Y10_029289 [Tritrichomonas musculus]|uniref:Uncharacterized protein n=1 Tax=Tritrichomonas musculus TaxID=1915356 RepID=A0ABR2KNR9_9EUKA